MRAQQLGSGLIEVMVALVILSIGSLGMISMQLSALQQSNNAYLRTQATIKGTDILDRIRSNPEAMTGYLVSSGSENTACWNWQGDATGCSAANLAAADLHDWQTALAAILPSGAGRVCRSDLTDDLPGQPDCEAANSNHPIVAYIWWQSSRDANATPEMLTMSAEIQ
ncbi:type IV pilus modification protein PilV [Salinibius halmophilus]|uniref:type IV pilus modification protein PilV n=1 Tax=Salinibius halmophilus TaxID=1853216 RepID=UPI000E663B9E|nr:type IV pilus modification protein PilV [Salinibius halmophilus]